jgi:hypothetical protein
MGLSPLFETTFSLYCVTSAIDDAGQGEFEMVKRLLILLLLALVVLGLLINLSLAQTIILPTPTNAATFTLIASPTTYYVTTLIPTTTPGCAAPLPLVNGATAFVRAGVYIRTEPSASSPFVNYYTSSTAVTIIGGPVCDGLRYNWWQIKGPGNDGWVAEGSPANYFMHVGALPGPKCETAVNLTIGKTAQLLRDLKVHDQPADSALVITVASTGQQVDVLEGPQCGDDTYNWWKIRVIVVGVLYTGWVADRQPGGNDWLISVDVLNAPVCARPLPLAIGSHAYVDYKDHIPKNMRSGPSTDTQLVATLLDGIGFEVIGGPICAQGYNWWQISILSRPDVTGWLSEGGPQGYWISPLNIGPTRPV